MLNAETELEPEAGEALLRQPDLAEIKGMLDEPGPFARHGYPGFRHRPGQKKLLEATVDAFASGPGCHLAAEGGTGIGKSLAYLIPAVIHAAATGTTVLVATKTINLQDQLVANDIPQVVRVLELEGILAPGAFRHQALKGEGNYLCRHRWAQFRNAGQAGAPGLAPRVDRWLQSTSTGDVAELHLSGAQREAWLQVSGRRPQNCPYYRKSMHGCFLRATRQKARRCHLVVVSHALYLSAAHRNSGNLPHHDMVIIDEAHHFADEATQQISTVIHAGELSVTVEDARAQADRGADPAGNMALEHWKLSCHRIDAMLAEAGEASHEPVVDLSGSQDDRWLYAMRDWESYGRDSLGNLARSLRHAVRQQRALQNVNGEDTLGRLADEVEDLMLRADAFFAEDQEHVRMARRERGGLVMTAAPLIVSKHLRDLVFNPSLGSVLTSATLAPRGDFTHWQRELGITPDQPTVICESPFRYSEQALLLSPKDLPHPGQSSGEHERAVHDTLLRLATVLEGRTLALFTSKAALQRAVEALEHSLNIQGIQVVAQGRDGPASAVASSMEADPRTLGLGTDAMWEGIDLSPSALKAVVICRLPFPVPSDPLIRARSNLYGNPFNEYYLPQAVRKFRQGCGRLIRSVDSKGVLVVLDPRIRHQSYGSAFWRALPPVSMTKSVMGDVAVIAGEFAGVRGHPTTNGATENGVEPVTRA